MDDTSLNTTLVLLTTALGAVVAAFWLAFIIWTYNDMRARSRDPLAQIAAALMVAVLFVFGVVIYVMLRPRETLADAYERSLEEEALLQEIEEKPACPGCGRPTRHDWQVCPYCHTTLKKNCLNCGYLLELSWNLCPSCTTSQISDGSSAEALADSTPEKARNSSIASRLKSSRSPYEVEPNDNVEWVDSDY